MTTKPITARRLRELTEMIARDIAEHPMGQHGRVAYVSREELAELVRAAAETEAIAEENTRLRKTIEALRSRQAGLLRGREELAQVLREKAR